MSWIRSFVFRELPRGGQREELLRYRFYHLWSWLRCLWGFKALYYLRFKSRITYWGLCYSQMVVLWWNLVILPLCFVGSIPEFQGLFSHFKAFQERHSLSFQDAYQFSQPLRAEFLMTHLLTKMSFKIHDWSFTRFKIQSCYLLKSLISLKRLMKIMNFTLILALMSFKNL